MNIEEQRNDLFDETPTSLRLQLGQILQRARISQKKEIVEVARMLMLSQAQLAAVEAGQSETFHHELRYLQAIKSYVFYLNLENSPPVAQLLAQVETWFASGLNASPAAGVAQLHRSAAVPAKARLYTGRRPMRLYYALGVLLLTVAVVVALSEGWPFISNEMTREAAQAEPPVVSEVAPAPKAPTARTLPLAATTANETTAMPRSVDPSKSPSAMPEPVPSAPTTPSTSSALLAPANLVSSPKPAQAFPGASAGRMRIDFIGDCWVSFQTVDGKKEERIYTKGQHLEVPIASVAMLVLGNAPAAQITLGQRVVDIIGKPFAQGNVARIDQKILSMLEKN